MQHPDYEILKRCLAISECPQKRTSQCAQGFVQSSPFIKLLIEIVSNHHHNPNFTFSPARATANRSGEVERNTRCVPNTLVSRTNG